MLPILHKNVMTKEGADHKISSAESNRLLGHVAACAEAMLGTIGALSLYENKTFFHLCIAIFSGFGIEIGGKINVTNATLKTAETIGRGKLGRKEYKTNFVARAYDSFDASVAEGGVVKGVTSAAEQWKLASVKVGWTEQEPSGLMEGGEPISLINDGEASRPKAAAGVYRESDLVICEEAETNILTARDHCLFDPSDPTNG